MLVAPANMDAPAVVGNVEQSPRSAYLDNAKAILIILVVFLHLFSPVLARHEPERWFYYLVLFFHMPAFAFVSGWLSRSELFTKKGLRSLAWLIWAYVVMTMINHLMWVVLFDLRFRPVAYLRDPNMALWFLQALIWWRLLLVVFGRGRGWTLAIGSVAAAFAVAVFSGYLPIQGSHYSVSRTLAFLPFFVAGYRFRQLELDVPRTWWSRGLALGAFVAVFAALSGSRFLTTPRPLFFDRTFAELGDPVWATIPGRAMLMTVGVILVAAFLHLVPRRRLVITSLGVTVMSVYVWHALLVRLMKQLELSEVLVGTWPRFLACVSIIVLVFGYGPVAKATVRVLSGRRV